MALTWTVTDKPAGCNYENWTNGTIRAGETLAFDYTISDYNDSTATVVAPASVLLTIAPANGDTPTTTKAATVTDNSTNYNVRAVVSDTLTTTNWEGEYLFGFKQTYDTGDVTTRKLVGGDLCVLESLEVI